MCRFFHCCLLFLFYCLYTVINLPAIRVFFVILASKTLIFLEKVNPHYLKDLWPLKFKTIRRTSFLNFYCTRISLFAETKLFSLLKW